MPVKHTRVTGGSNAAVFVKSARPERSSFTVWASARPRRRVLSVTLTSSGVPAPGRGRELAFPVYIPAPPAGGGAERQRREGLRGRQPSPCRVRPGRARQLLPHPPSSLLRMRLHAGPVPLNLSLRCRNGACVVIDFAALRRWNWLDTFLRPWGMSLVSTAGGVSGRVTFQDAGVFLFSCPRGQSG